MYIHLICDLRRLKDNARKHSLRSDISRFSEAQRAAYAIIVDNSSESGLDLTSFVLGSGSSALPAGGKSQRNS